MRNYMYLRPGNLDRSFQVKRLKVKSEKGYPVHEYIDTGESVQGVLAEATKKDTERTLHRWDQDQHSLTHTLVIRGRYDIRKEDYLILGERGFFVLTCDDIAGLGIAGIVYLEERNDFK